MTVVTYFFIVSDLNPVDSWLGFLGGYLGGLLAFFSAIFLFYKQKIEASRPYLNLIKTDESKPTIAIYFLKEPEGVKINPDNLNTIGIGRSDKKAILAIKNVGSGLALNVKLFDSTGIEAVQFSIKHKWFTKFKSITSLEVQEKFFAYYCFDTLAFQSSSNSRGEILSIHYSDIYGTLYKQKLYFEYNVVNNKCGFNLEI